MPGRKIFIRHKALCLTGICIVICSTFFMLPAVRLFLITDFKTGEILYASDISTGDSFSISYIHSVNKSPVEDMFYIDSDYNTVLTKSIFRSFGAGMPSTVEDGGRYVYFKDRIELTDINRKIDSLLLFAGVIADHHFRMKGKDIKLIELVPPQRNVHFGVRKITVYRYIEYTCKKGRIG